MVGRLMRLETQDNVRLEVKKDILAQLERFQTALRSTTIWKKPTTEAVNTLCADVNKLLEQQSSLSSRLNQG